MATCRTCFWKLKKVSANSDRGSANNPKNSEAHVEVFRVHDKASWHFEHKSYPANTGPAGAHIYGGLFLAWAHANGLLSSECKRNMGGELAAFEKRGISPGRFYQLLGGVLASDLFTDEGKGFAGHSFCGDEFDYYGLVESTLGNDLLSPYLIADSWQTTR
jgi:hypothetical protein